jgi:putative addiction module component (TIGR02574 family)
MSTATTKSVLDAALALPASDRALIADTLMDSLALSDPVVERAWAEEAESRYEAYKAGRLETIPLDDVFKRQAKP